MKGPARARQPHHEHPQLHQHPGDHGVELPEVHLGLRARLVRLRHHDLHLVQAQLCAAAGDIPRHRHLGHARAVLGDQPLPDPAGGMPLLARHVPVSQQPPVDDRRIRADRRPRPLPDTPSAAAAPRWPAPAAPSAGAHDGGQPAPGSMTPPARQSRLICSNSSTRDLAIPDLHADSNDVTIRSRVGPKFATTRRPTRQARSPPRRGQNSRRQKAKPGPVQVITLSRYEYDADRLVSLLQRLLVRWPRTFTGPPAQRHPGRGQ